MIETFLFGSTGAAQKSPAAGTSAQAPANGFSVMMQALTNATAAPVETGGVPQMAFKGVGGAPTAPAVLQQVAQQFGTAKVPGALGDETADEVGGTLGSGDGVSLDQVLAGGPDVDVAGLAALAGSNIATPKLRAEAQPVVATATAATSALTQKPSLVADPDAVQRSTAAVANLGVDKGLQVSGTSGQVLPQTPAPGNPLQPNMAAPQTDGRAVLAAAAQTVSQSPTAVTVTSPQTAAPAITSAAEKPAVGAAPQATLVSQPAQSLQAPVDDPEQAQSTGKGAAPTGTDNRQPTPAVAAPDKTTGVIPAATVKATAEPAVAGTQVDRSLTQTAAAAQTAPAVSEPLGTALATQRRAVMRDADPSVAKVVSADTDRAAAGTELKTVRSEVLLQSNAAEPNQPKTKMPAFVGAADAASSTVTSLKPEQPGVTPIGVKPQDELRPLQPAVVAPQPAELRAAAPLDPAAPGTHKAPAKPMAEALMAQVRSVDVQEGRTTVNLHPRGLGIIEVEMIAERDAASKVIVRVENPLVLQTLREERQLLAQTIGIADSSVMSFEESTSGERTYGGADDDGQQQGAFTTDTQDAPAPTHENVVDDGVLDVLT